MRVTLSITRVHVYLLALLCLVVCTLLLSLYIHLPLNANPTTDASEWPFGAGPLEVLTSQSESVQFVHQSWKTADLPPRFQKWSNTWRKCFPKAHHVLWTDVDNRNFIVKHYPWFLKRYDEMGSNIQQADSIKYLYMFHYGGIYTDLDNECLRPFEFLLKNTTMAFGAMESENVSNTPESYVQNSFMYSTPRHPMWLELIQDIMKSPKMGEPQNTGSAALAGVISAYRKRLKSSAGITVYPPLFFNPFGSLVNKVKVCKNFNQMTEVEMAACRAVLIKKSYVVQYHAHKWGGGKTSK